MEVSLVKGELKVAQKLLSKKISFNTSFSKLLAVNGGFFISKIQI